MKTKYFKKNKKSYNSINPFNYSETINTNIINGNYSKVTIELQKYNEKSNFNLRKKQGINFNLSEIVQPKNKFSKNNNDNDISKNYTNKTSKIKRNIKLPVESEISQSRNFNKINSNSLSRTTMTSLSLTNNDKYSNNSKIKKIEYDLDKLIDTGIKYCIDEDGNPMDISDIKTKNKNPIAFIIQTSNKNILMDTNNKIIIPSKTGDYTLPHKPYIIIHKYDVLHPELRVIKSNRKDNKENESIISNKNLDRRKNNKSSNLFDVDLKRLNGLDEINENCKENFQLFSPVVKSKLKIYNNLNKNIKNPKRKYIFVNRLNENEFNKSIQIKLNKNINNNINNNSLSKDNFEKYNNTVNDNYFNKENHFSTISIDENNKMNTQFSNNAFENKLKEKLNKNILEFNFERKYRTINNNYSIENLEEKEIKETPNKKSDNKILNNFNSIQSNTNFNRTKKILNVNSKLDLNKFKRQRYSYSLNEFMLNPLLASKQLKNKKINKTNTLNTLNQSLATPYTEKTAYSTIQKTVNESEKNKSLKKSKINLINNNKYYLKPKIGSGNFFHKRINTENFNTEKSIKFLQTIKNIHNADKSNINKTNYITPFTLTEVDYKIKHDSNCNNNVNKCPFCHNLFYN